MLRVRVVILLGAFTLLLSCATSGNPYKVSAPKSGYGRLYVYRANMVTDRFMRAQISAGKQLKFLESGRFVSWELPQGDYALTSNCPTGEGEDLCAFEISVQVISGEEHFVRFNARQGNDMDSSLSKVFSNVTNEQPTVKKLGYLQPVGRPQGREELRALTEQPL